MTAYQSIDLTRFGAPVARPDDRDPATWVVVFAAPTCLLPVGEARVRMSLEQLAALSRLAKEGCA